jgi:membrane protease YdiL (CAAX protease family)
MTSLATAWLIVAVSAEEFVFRGVIFVALQHLGGPVVALAGSTAAFTLAHVAADPGPSILLVLVLGAYLGILRLITSNL